MTTANLDAPEVPILLLGDAEVGKSSWLSRLTLGHDYQLASLDNLPVLRDLDQPFVFNVSMYNRPYRFEFYDTASPEHYTLLKPAVIVLCYSVANPNTLQSVYTTWKHLVETHFNYDENIPVVVLGLQRDIRRKEDYGGSVRPMVNPSACEDLLEALNGRTFTYPEEGMRVAMEMRCDTYCECSALTGQNCREAFEDIARKAAMTTTAKGGKSDGTQCCLM